jgi:preprotein translocase SecE subunit
VPERRVGFDKNFDGCILKLQFNSKRPLTGFFRIRIFRIRSNGTSIKNLIIYSWYSILLVNIRAMSILSYFAETKGELSHVNWPTKRQSIIFSVVVIIISVLVAFFLGLFDFIFSKILSLFIS